MTTALTTTFPPTEPMPVVSRRAPWSDTLSSLRVPNFRLFSASNVLAMSGSWMQRIAQDWLVLELSGSVTAVGITVALQFAPMLLFGLYGGLIVDRYSKRMLLMLTQAVVAVLSTVLAVLAITGVVEVWHVFVIAFLVGMVTVVDNPTRQVFVNELVGPRHLRNAISVNSSVFQLGGLIGPAVAGVLLVAVGAGWAFAINAITCLVTILTLWQLKTSKLIRTPPMPRSKGQLQQGLAYVLGKPAIFWSVVMVAILSVFALTMPVILSSYATDVFQVGAAGYGLFNTLVAGGALAGAILSTRRRGVRLRSVVITGIAWGVLQATAGLMPNELSFGILLVALGVANLLFITAANSLVQMSSNIGIRGRVMSLYVLVLLGGQAIGGPLMGWIVENHGAQFGMAVSGIVPAAAAALIGIHLARRGHLTLRVGLQRRSPLVSIVRRIDGGFR
ncbi:putative MFS family arabinose efflux permease [Glaciihabitans tibetensis]|uniref:Putative MFS family arabinose efflux permease n=1 Tax=Glaciihabitans tibetensis TaxID=1266600 RepID=A0A2T0VIH4_9MICO|nr:MFS transporter [Glaciihabitans tibetensis]PRY70034.1 putative MFS family arabinose efflux permease [Glaciihabitans tibetensis]